MGRGKLVFKGEEKKAKKAKKSSSKKRRDEDTTLDVDVAPAAASTSCETIHANEGSQAAAAEQNRKQPVKSEQSAQAAPKVTSGQGLITTSGTVVSGHGTSFQSQLRVGDAILARVSSNNNKNNKNAREEMRVITMVLSPISISLSSAFSTDLKTPSPYSFINKPRDAQKERAKKAQLAKEEQEAIENQAMGTYRGSGEVVYREKTEHGGYRIRREKVESGRDLDRSDLLNVRSKKKSDRYC